MPVDKFGRMSDTKTRDTGVSLTYINNNYIRSDGKSVITGALNMNFNEIMNLRYPVVRHKAATMEFVENYVYKKLDLLKRPHIIAVHASYSGPLKKKY